MFDGLFILVILLFTRTSPNKNLSATAYATEQRNGFLLFYLPHWCNNHRQKHLGIKTIPVFADRSLTSTDACYITALCTLIESFCLQLKISFCVSARVNLRKALLGIERKLVCLYARPDCLLVILLSVPMVGEVCMYFANTCRITYISIRIAKHRFNTLFVWNVPWIGNAEWEMLKYFTHLKLFEIEFGNPPQQFEGNRCQTETWKGYHWRRLSFNSWRWVWRQQRSIQHRNGTHQFCPVKSTNL